MVVAALAFALLSMALRTAGTWSFVVPLAGGATALIAVPLAGRRSFDCAIAPTALGIAAFALVRLAHPMLSPRATGFGLVASALAAVGEELLFRHGLYSLLERHGALIAVVGSALAFGLVHAPMYGWSVVPLDVAAGVVFGWQRWATGSWASPAATHAFANVIGSL
jgi:membrane protease YdiL (CAAX protease family)